VEFVNQVQQGVVIFFFVSLRCQAYLVVVLETMVAGLVDRNIAGPASWGGCWPSRQTLGHVAVLDDRDFVSTLLVFLAANYLVVASAMAAY
jgi:hypothetical protein